MQNGYIEPHSLAGRDFACARLAASSLAGNLERMIFPVGFLGISCR